MTTNDDHLLFIIATGIIRRSITDHSDLVVSFERLAIVKGTRGSTRLYWAQTGRRSSFVCFVCVTRLMIRHAITFSVERITTETSGSLLRQSVFNGFGFTQRHSADCGSIDRGSRAQQKNVGGRERKFLCYSFR